MDLNLEKHKLDIINKRTPEKEKPKKKLNQIFDLKKKKGLKKMKLKSY